MPGKVVELTNQEKEFIQQNHTIMTFTAMARKLKRVPKKISEYMEQESLPKLRNLPPPENHAFRRANIGLRRQLDSLRIHNKKGGDNGI